MSNIEVKLHSYFCYRMVNGDKFENLICYLLFDDLIERDWSAKSSILGMRPHNDVASKPVLSPQNWYTIDMDRAGLDRRAAEAVRKVYQQ